MSVGTNNSLGQPFLIARFTIIEFYNVEIHKLVTI